MLFSSSALSTALTPRMVSLVTSGASSSSSSGDEDWALSDPPTATSAASTTARTLGKRRERGMAAPTSASHGPPNREAGRREYSDRGNQRSGSGERGGAMLAGRALGEAAL